MSDPSDLPVPRISWVRLLIGALLVEIGAIIVLVVFVAIFGPNEYHAAQVYAERIGLWVGPIAGAILTFIGALVVTRRLRQGRVLHGTLFGLCVVLVDVTILLAMKAPFEWIFVISDAGKLIAGYLGGVLSARCESPR